MSVVVRFLKMIFLVDLLKGLWVTLKYTPQPAFTFQYPAERRPRANMRRWPIGRASTARLLGELSSASFPDR